jgi:hypothetical protein
MEVPLGHFAIRTEIAHLDHDGSHPIAAPFRVQLPSAPVRGLRRYEREPHAIGARDPAAAGQRYENLPETSHVRSDQTAGLEMEGVDMRCAGSARERHSGDTDRLEFSNGGGALG